MKIVSLKARPNMIHGGGGTEIAASVVVSGPVSEAMSKFLALFEGATHHVMTEPQRTPAADAVVDAAVEAALDRGDAVAVSKEDGVTTVVETPAEEPKLVDGGPVVRRRRPVVSPEEKAEAQAELEAELPSDAPVEPKLEPAVEAVVRRRRPVDAPAQTEITMNDLVKACALASERGVTEAAINALLLGTFYVKNIGGIANDKRQEFLDALKALA